MTHCFLNVDLGELPHESDELYQLADIANIACGGHAGDNTSMTQALARCRRYGTRAGVHPSYPDPQGFGRTPQTIEPERLKRLMYEQCKRLADQAMRLDVHLDYLKPHGALYHAADKDLSTAHAVIAGAVAALGDGICIIGPAGGALEVASEVAGIAFAREDFADRARRADGSLVPRSAPGAMITDPAIAHALALKLARSGVVDTLCVHGDSLNAVAIARAVRMALDDAALTALRHEF